MRALTELEKRILAIVEPEARAMGLEIVRIRMMGSRRPTLQIMAEKADGTMDVEDCADLSRAIGPALDVDDPIPGEYTLEVSSPGIDRPLTREGDFSRWAGHEARVELAIPFEGRKRFHGTIVSEKAGMVTLDLKDGARAEIPFDEMSKASLVLTDDLIAEAQARGQADEVDEEEFDEIEDASGDRDADEDEDEQEGEG